MVQDVMAEKSIEAWDEDYCRQVVYNFFGGSSSGVALFPSITIDEENRTETLLGYHSRLPNYDPVTWKLVEIAEAEPWNNIPTFKLIQTLVHEIPHAVLSYCFASVGLSTTREGTPPDFQYLERYTGGGGEIGFWMDMQLWGGALWYEGMTSHSVSRINIVHLRYLVAFWRQAIITPLSNPFGHFRMVLQAYISALLRPMRKMLGWSSLQKGYLK
ncbi:hypothetical protein ABW19_dt0204667 [Dactylella cylindrospora]|nr:hypothetical protein ABW19_dt0204667 [Dactylella cylindrospora]